MRLQSPSLGCRSRYSSDDRKSRADESLDGCRPGWGDEREGTGATAASDGGKGSRSAAALVDRYLTLSSATQSRVASGCQQGGG